MAAYRNVERFADPESTKTPVDKAPRQDLGTGFISKERYTSHEFAEREWDAVWTKTWLLGADIADLEKAGDYVVTEIGDQSVILTRDEKGDFKSAI